MKLRVLNLLFLLLFLAGACDENYMQELGGISLELSGKYYPTKLFQEHDTLFVVLSMPEKDFISMDKQILTKQYVMNTIIREHKVSHFDYVFIQTVQLEDHNNHNNLCISFASACSELHEIGVDTAWDKWAIHLIKNNSGENIEKYNRYFRVVASDPKNEIHLSPENLNFITILQMYNYQCRGKKVPVNAEALLHLLDTFCTANSNDSVIWNHDYNPEELNYYFRQGDLLKQTKTN